MKIFKIELSNKREILIDEEDLNKFKANLDKSFIQLKKGIVNPSFVVCITRDKEASREASKTLEYEKDYMERIKLLK